MVRNPAAVLLALSLSCWVAVLTEAAEAPVAEVVPGKDFQGDPLPPQAIARFGSVRWRHEGTVTALAYSPDEKYIVSGCVDKKIRLWDATTGKEVRQFVGHTEEVRSVSMSPDSSLIASASLDETVRVWETATGKEREKHHQHEDGIECVAFSPDGKYVVSGSRDWTVRIKHLGPDGNSEEMGKHNSTVHAVAFSPDGKLLATCSADKTVYLWRMPAGGAVRILPKFQAAVLCVAFSSDGKSIAAGSKDGTIKICNVADGKEHKTFVADGAEAIWSMAFSPNSTTLVTAGDGKAEANGRVKTVRFWDARTGKELHDCAGHPRPLKQGKVHSDFATAQLGAAAVVFSRDGTKVVTGGIDGRIRIWDPPTGKEFGGKAPAVQAAALSPDGTLAALLGDDRKLRLCEVKSGKEIGSVELGTGSPRIEFTPAGTHLMVVAGAEVRLLEIPSCKETRTFKADREPITYARLSYDGKQLVTVSTNAFRVWDTQEGKEVSRGKREDPINASGFSPDGKVLALGCQDGSVYFWDHTNSRLLKATIEQRYPVRSLAFFDSGDVLATSGIDDSNVHLWDTKTAQEIRTLNGHEDSVEQVVFSPRGSMLASGCRAGVIRLWELASGKPRRILKGHHNDVTELVFSRDGRRLLSLSNDGVAMIWDLYGAGKKPKDTLEKRALDTLWAELGQDDVGRAFEALQTFQLYPALTIPYLKERVLVVSKKTSERIRKLIADLDADDFELREKAKEDLAGLGSIVVEPLREALKKKGDSLEFTRRAEQILEKLDSSAPSPEVLRVARSIELLEFIAGKEAVDHLQELADGLPEASSTREAKAALARIKRRGAE